MPEEAPMEWQPEADVPLSPMDGESDERVLAVAAKAAELQEVIRQEVPYGPKMELALRYADLAVQSARDAAHESPPLPTGEAESPGTGVGTV